MTAGTAERLAPEPKAPFAPRHPWDRNYFLAMLGLIWLGLLVGFGWDVLIHVNKHQVNWPIIVHMHAFAMVAWLVLFTTQMLFIRAGDVARHRTLGVAGALVALFVVVLGLGVGIAMDRHYMGTKDADPSFLSIQLNDVILFGGLVLAALLLRGDSSAHKRLMLLASLQLTDAGYGRWIPIAFPQLMGPHFLGDWIGFESVTAVLVVSVGAYDLITRKRLNPAYVVGAVAVLAGEALAIWLYLTPAWKPIATKLIGF